MISQALEDAKGGKSKSKDEEPEEPEEEEDDEEIEHADAKDEKGETVKEIFDSMNEKQKNVVYFMIGQALKDAKGETDDEEPEEDEEDDEEIKHADKEEGEKKMAKERTVKDVFDEMTEEQKNVVYFMIGQALEDAGVDAGGNNDEDEEEDEEEEEDMKHNVFDTDYETGETVLSHDAMQTNIAVTLILLQLRIDAALQEQLVQFVLMKMQPECQAALQEIVFSSYL